MNKNGENHFLLEKYMELQQQVHSMKKGENVQKQNENIPQGWMNPNWVRQAPAATSQHPVISVPSPSHTVQPTMMNPGLVQWIQPQGRVQQG